MILPPNSPQKTERFDVLQKELKMEFLDYMTTGSGRVDRVERYHISRDVLGTKYDHTAYVYVYMDGSWDIAIKAHGGEIGSITRRLKSMAAAMEATI